MGIPSFYRWVTTRFPKLVIARGNRIKPMGFDNLYIDMNGVIHPCCRTGTGNEYCLNEAEMVARILEYLEHVFDLIRPRKMLYLAIDGVAPRAKMNQQRARRYESARERRKAIDDEDEEDVFANVEIDSIEREMERIRQSLDLGIAGGISCNHDLFQASVPPTPQSPGMFPSTPKSEELLDSLAFAHSEDFGAKNPDPLGWDSNQISPGTPFMTYVANCIRYFIRYKQSTDTNWANVVVILSDSNSFGEGEHKMVNFIKAQRAQDGYDKKTTHLLCGMDADLILLALALHEPHVYILREKRSKVASGIIAPKNVGFEILSVKRIREYLDLEFCVKKEKPFDLERVIDDFILLCALVGNDFLPHLPSCFIDDMAIDNLLEIYRRALPTLGGYLTREDGLLDFEKLGYVLKQYSKVESSKFLMEVSSQMESRSERDPLNYNKDDWKDMYYKSMGIKSKEDQARIVKSYIEGLSWVTNYYMSYHAVSGLGPNKTQHCLQNSSHWRWFFPYNYAPLAYDVAVMLENSALDLEISIQSNLKENTEPFHPLTQLLAILPPDSVEILPNQYRNLMLSPSSPIASFYPDYYYVDPNGQSQEWKYIVVLPFVDEELLLKTINHIPLDPPDMSRNELHAYSDIFVHRNHPLASVLRDTAKNEHIDYSPITRQWSKSSPFFGLIRLSSKDELSYLGVRLSSSEAKIPDLNSNMSICFHFIDPNIPKDVKIVPERTLVVKKIAPKEATPTEHAVVQQVQPKPKEGISKYFSRHFIQQKLSLSTSKYLWSLTLMYLTTMAIELIRVAPMIGMKSSLIWMKKISVITVGMMSIGYFVNRKAIMSKVQTTEPPPPPPQQQQQQQVLDNKTNGNAQSNETNPKRKRRSKRVDGTEQSNDTNGSFNNSSLQVVNSSVKSIRLHEGPVGTYRDWVCEVCLTRNFYSNKKCFKCSEPYRKESVSIFTPKKMLFNPPRVVIDHSQNLIKCKGKLISKRR